MVTERDHRGRSIVWGMLNLDDVSPDSYYVQSHVIENPESLPSVSDLRVHRICTRQLRTAVSPHPLKIGHMFIRTYLLRIVHTTTS